MITRELLSKVTPTLATQVAMNESPDEWVLFFSIREFCSFMIEWPLQSCNISLDIVQLVFGSLNLNLDTSVCLLLNAEERPLSQRGIFKHRWLNTTDFSTPAPLLLSLSDSLVLLWGKVWFYCVFYLIAVAPLVCEALCNLRAEMCCKIDEVWLGFILGFSGVLLLSNLSALMLQICNL